jgi:hypothetical protein
LQPDRIFENPAESTVTDADQLGAEITDTVVGPMLEAYKAGNVPGEFDASWDELRDFRMAIPDDIRELRDEAPRRVSEGRKDIQLVFPEYPLLSWESE